MLLIICYSRIESRRNKKDPQRIIKTKPFMKKFSIRKRWLEKFEKNNPTIALSVLYAKKEKIYPPYVSKHKSNREKQVFLLMIPKRDGWHKKNYSKKIIIIIKKNYVKIPRWFLLSELVSFFCKRKQTWIL